jgi:hypothetical protein
VPLATDPSGFKRHGDLCPGDEVFSPSGGIIKVLAVVDHTGDAVGCEVALDTGEKIVVHAEHLWLTWTEFDRNRSLRSSEAWRANRRANRPSRAKAVSQKPWVSKSVTAINRARQYEIVQPTGSIKTTDEIARTVLVADGGRLNHSIDVSSAIDCPYVVLPIDPYLFGLWIGDGQSRQPIIGMAETDWNELAPFVPQPDVIRRDERPPRKVPFIDKRFSFALPLLRQLGVLGAKRIPPLYLRASREQRIALLQGILDTDGTCDLRGQIEVGFSDEQLAGDLHELVSSLGTKATLRRKETTCQTGPGKPHWRLKCLCPFAAFRLARKLRRQKLTGFRPTVRRRYICSVTQVQPRPMRCIKVDAPDGLYLVGRSFVTTHNTDLGFGLL